MRSYSIELVGGPGDGFTLSWAWYNNEEGYEGERDGVLLLGKELTYQCNTDKTRAEYVSGPMSEFMLECIERE